MTLDGRISELIAFFQKNWHEHVGLLVAEIVACLLVRFFFTGLAQTISYGVAVVLVATMWLLGRRLPRAGKGKLGFVICISCEKDAQARRLREDFIDTLRLLVESDEGGKQLQLIVVQNHMARRVRDTDDARRVSQRTRASFMLYGRARLRSVGKKDVWILDLNGMVKDALIPEQMGRKFSLEIRELLPSRLQFPHESDVLAFEFTSKLVDVVARYIMAFAAGLSGQLDYAECLFKETEARIARHMMHPVNAKITKRLPRHFAAIHLTRAAAAYDEWLKTRQDSEIEQYCAHLSQVPASERHSGHYIMKQALCLFQKEHDPQSALKILRDHPYGENPGWLFSVAFLHAYCGELRRATKHYRALRFTEVSPRVLMEIEEFFYWLEGEEPDNWVVNYCLGYVNWWVKCDIESAVKEFRRFLAKLPQNERKDERKRVERLLRTALTQVDQPIVE